MSRVEDVQVRMPAPALREVLLAAPAEGFPDVADLTAVGAFNGDVRPRFPA